MIGHAMNEGKLGRLYYMPELCPLSNCSWAQSLISFLLQSAYIYISQSPPVYNNSFEFNREEPLVEIVTVRDLVSSMDD